MNHGLTRINTDKKLTIRVHPCSSVVICFLCLFLSSFLLSSCSQEKQPTTKATNNSPKATSTNAPFQFPRDEGVHSEAPIEWWYLNSHFTDAAGNKYAFFFCTFSTGRH